MKKKFNLWVYTHPYLKKLIMELKIAILLIVTCISSALATPGYSQVARVSLEMENKSLEQVMDEIEKQSEFYFIFNQKQIDVKRIVDIRVENELITDILPELFKGTNVSYEILDRKILLTTEQNETNFPEPAIAESQQNKIAGIITDKNGAPIAGANIVAAGTTVGTISDINGKYAIDVPQGAKSLKFTFIGMEPQEVIIGSLTQINVTMAEAGIGLDEVVVIGYGTVKKKDFTGSVGSINMKELKEVSVTNIDDALQGKVAGVQVKLNTGEPGLGAQIRIRGIGSISAGVDPLYVVDGFPIGNINNLNPNDIESIDILKDASATAIYGSRGANGVILINTKRGKSGKAIFTIDSYYGLQKELSKPDYMNSMQMAEYFYDSVRNRNIDAGNDVSGDPVTGWKLAVPIEVMQVLDGTNTIDTDWHDEVLRVSPTKQFQLSAMGGNDIIKFAVSGTYLDDEGIVLGSEYKRYSLRSNIDAQLSKKLAIKVNLAPTFTQANIVANTGAGNSASEAVIGSASALNPWFPVYNPDGTYFVMNGLPHGGNYNNAVADANEIDNRKDGMQILGNINAEYTIIDALKFNINLGINSQTYEQNKFKPNIPSLVENMVYGESTASSRLNWLTEYTLNYSKSFNKHTVAGLAGFTAQKENYKSNYLYSDKFPNNLVKTLSAVGGIITNGNSSEGSWSMVSYLARGNYNYDNKYYVTASIRTDGSSRFGSENKYGVFPSMALAWRISNENFLKDVKFLNDLKLRASYGVTGNNNIGDYSTYATVSYENYTLGGLSLGGYGQALISNPFLTWEKQKQLNSGLDINLFKGRLILTTDYFYSLNSSLLLNVNIPQTTGFSTSLQNIGEVKNTGWEFALTSVNTTGKFEWTTDFNISFYQNEVLQLGPEGDPIYSMNSKTEVGQPIGRFYGLKTNGIFKTQEELNNGPIFSPGTSVRSRLGDLRFVDVSGPNGVPDGVINSLDKTIIGSPHPDFFFGFNNRFTFQNITLSVGIQGSHGNEIMHAVANSVAGRARTKQPLMVYDYWKSETDHGSGDKYAYRPNDAPTGGLREVSDLSVYDGSYIRVNNIMLSYLLPNSVTQKLKISSLRFYVNAINPFLISTYPFWNPDVSTSSNPLTPGYDNNDYPVTKSLLFGISLSF
jgi:TonB-linked SusC/RagA family outer membrane protein